VVQRRYTSNTGEFDTEKIPVTEYTNYAEKCAPHIRIVHEMILSHPINVLVWCQVSLHTVFHNVRKRERGRHALYTMVLSHHMLQFAAGASRRPFVTMFHPR
jgi:hypothetical protein